MKKFLALCLFVVSAASLPAELPQRVFEFGFDFDVGVSNNVLGLGDIFWSPDQKLLIDFDKLPLGGMGVNMNTAFGGLMNINVGSFGFGSFTGVEAAAYGSFSDELRKLLADGYRGNFKGELALGASAFVESGLRGEFRIPALEGWKFSAGPTYYIPLLYIPKPRDAAFKLNSDDDSLTMGADFAMEIYTPFSLEEWDMDSGFLGGVFDSAGFDLSLGAEYRLFSFLDVGGNISHIPLAPARLSHSMKTTYSMDEINLELFDAIMNDNMPTFEMENETTYDDAASYLAFRPLRFDFYGLYRPFESDLITIKPMLGLSFLTIYGYEEACFNAGVSALLSYKIVSLELSNIYRERLWRHTLDLVLNLGVIELDLGVGMQSQGFLESFAARGLGVSLGFRLGVPKARPRPPRTAPPPLEPAAPLVEPAGPVETPEPAADTGDYEERARELVENENLLFPPEPEAAPPADSPEPAPDDAAAPADEPPTEE